MLIANTETIRPTIAAKPAARRRAPRGTAIAAMTITMPTRAMVRIRPIVTIAADNSISSDA